MTLLPLRDGAIINPSNTGMILTNRGIGQQLLRRAGPFIQQTLHTERSRLRGGRLDPGHVLATDAGQLQASKLIHVAIVGGRKVNARLIARGEQIETLYVTGHWLDVDDAFDLAKVRNLV